MWEAGPQVPGPEGHPVEELVDAEQDRRHRERDPQEQEGLERRAADVTPERAETASDDRPTRRALYRYIAAQSVPVGREDVAAAVGVPHHVARFHLDRLHEAGLLEVE